MIHIMRRNFFTLSLSLLILITSCTTKRNTIDYLNIFTEMYALKVSSECRPCDDYGMFILLLFPIQKRYIYRVDISMMQEGSYTERNDSLFLMPSLAMEAESYSLDDYYNQYVYAKINDSTQSNVVTDPKIFKRLKDGDIAEVLRHFDFNKSYYRNGIEYYAIPKTIGNLDFHEFPQDIRDSIMATMTETHIIYQRVKLSK